MTIKDKQREVVLTVATVIFAAFLIDFLSKVVFTEIYETYKVVSILSSIILLAVTAFIIYSVSVSGSRRNITEAAIPATFRQSTGRFVDLPHCPLSVHMRVQFNRLPAAGRKHLSLYNHPAKYWGSELQRFTDQVVQEMILGIVLDQPEFVDRKYKKILFNDFPEGIKENLYFKYWIDKVDGFCLYIPGLKSMSTYGRNNSFIRINTEVGRVLFEWHPSFATSAYYSKYFLKYRTEKQLEDYHDFVFNIKCTGQTSAWKLLTSKMTEYSEWMSTIEATLKSSDWKFSAIERLYEVIESIRHGSSK